MDRVRIQRCPTKSNGTLRTRYRLIGGKGRLRSSLILNSRSGCGPIRLMWTRHSDGRVERRPCENGWSTKTCRRRWRLSPLTPSARTNERSSESAKRALPQYLSSWVKQSARVVARIALSSDFGTRCAPGFRFNPDEWQQRLRPTNRPVTQVADTTVSNLISAQITQKSSTGVLRPVTPTT